MKTGGWITLASLVVLAVVVMFVVWNHEAEAAVPTITLDWTAPGDDGNVGTAATYEMRMSTVPVGADTTAWWNAAQVVPGLPNPQIAGTRQSLVLTSSLNWSTTYYFVMVACDDGLPKGTNPVPVPNCSGYSNVASKNTGVEPDTVPPARITDLMAR